MKFNFTYNLSMKHTNLIALLIISVALALSCKKTSDPAPQPGPPDPAIRDLTPSHGPKDTKVAINFDRFLDPLEAPSKLLVAGVSIPFTASTTSSFSMIQFIVPKG